MVRHKFTCPHCLRTGILRTFATPKAMKKHRDKFHSKEK